MNKSNAPPTIALPRSWKRCVRSAVLHVISMARFAAAHAHEPSVTRSSAARLKNENQRLRSEIALLTEELRIKDARLARIPPHRRPHYRPTERLAILELRAARGWSVAQVAAAFHLAPLTVSTWMRRLDESGPGALLELHEPVNRFGDFVRYSVQRLGTLCPAMGKVKIAEILCRAGLHLGTTTVGRMLKETPLKIDTQEAADARTVTANRPNHVWHVDMTTVPTGRGFWTSWLPFSVPQCWPFCWWIAVVVDHFSRRAMGIAVFDRQPDAAAVRRFLARTIRQAGCAPGHLISDKGTQFWPNAQYKRWCRRRGIRPRFGAVGRQGSIAVVERFIRTMKEQCTKRLLVPLDRPAMRRELCHFVEWYNAHRPHTALGGKTPDEVYHQERPANRRPRIEPRQCWPRASPCARPVTLVAGQPGDRFTLRVEFYQGRRHLPIVSLERAA